MKSVQAHGLYRAERRWIRFADPLLASKRGSRVSKHSNNTHLQVRSKMYNNGMRSSIQMSMNSSMEMSMT